MYLNFGPLQGWYRFWECGIEDIQPDEEVAQKLKASLSLLSLDWRNERSRHQEKLQALVAALLQPGEQIVYQLYCGAQLPLGTRSRAGDHDQVTVKHSTLHAYEKADGVIAFGPGRSFWYHPRGMTFRIDGFPPDHALRKWKILLHTFDPQALNTRHNVSVGNRELGKWIVPVAPYDFEAFFSVDLQAGDVDERGFLTLRLQTDQTQLLHWWKDKGFIAALHALWVIET